MTPLDIKPLKAAVNGGLLSLTLYAQWVVWRPTPPDSAGERWKKTLLSARNGKAASSTDPKTWSDYQTAIDYAELHGLGVGFVFTNEDPFFFVDIDDCYTPDIGWSPIANELCQRLSGAYVEVSVSGTGLHIIGVGKRPEGYQVKTKIGFDVYEWGRWAALTGVSAVGDCTTDHAAEINRIVTTYMKPKDAGNPDNWTTAPCSDWSGYIDDTDLIDAARRSKSVAGVFSHKASFNDLWTANNDALAVSYPHDSKADTYDASAADAALCQHLAFWTGKDCERIDRLFRQSALHRDKWDKRPDYRMTTILGAVGGCRSVHQRPQVPDAQLTASVAPAPSAVSIQPRYTGITSGQGVYGDGKDTENAATFLQCWYPDESLKFYQEQAYRYTGQCWEQVDNTTLTHELAVAMWAATPKSATVSSTLKMLSFRCNDPHIKNMGAWPGRDVSHLTICQNGVLDVHTGQLEPHNPMFFTTAILPYSYDPHATAPAWLEFLNSTLEGDSERIALLQEWMGYMLVNDYTYHKAMLLVGAPRSGKGTIGRILNELCGNQAFMGMTLDGFAQDKTMEAALDKTVLFIGDAHSVSGPDRNRILDRLMSITGNDSLTVGRLYKQSFSGQLPGRITIAANTVPTFFDDSGAFGNRLLIIPFNRSFLGFEDPTLLKRLLTELPGICNWAIEGLQRLRATGRFTDPAIAREERQEMLEQQAPLLAFIREQCVLDATGAAFTADLYNRYSLWCVQNGMKAVSANRFTRDMKTTLRGHSVTKKAIYRDGRTAQGFGGLRLVADVSAPGNVTPMRGAV